MKGFTLANYLGGSVASQEGSADRLSFLFGLLYLTSFIFDSPLRWSLSLVSAEAAMYLRDVGAVVVIAIMLGRHLIFGTSSPVTLLAYFVGIFALYGFYQTDSLAQSVVGVKLLLPLLLGVSLAASVLHYWDEFRLWLYFVWFFSVAAVFYNYFFEMPWAGATFSSAMGEASVSREWTTAGVRRLAGLSRASYDAAAICAVGACLTLSDTRLHAAARYFLFFVSSLAVVLTTSKGPLIALAFVFMWSLAIKLFLVRDVSVVSYMLSSASFVLPALFYVYDIRFENAAFILSSFAERINSMWPSAYDNMDNSLNLFFGRGVGGIGTAQYFGEADIYNSADNFAVYVYGSMGLVGVGLFYWFLHRFSCNVLRADINFGYLPCLKFWLLFWLVCGFVTNMFEQPLLAFVIGLLVGFAFLVDPFKRHCRKA
jgi:hypothetical protein